MEPADLLKKVQKLAFRAKHVSGHLLAGQYHSHFRGKGMIFNGIRTYEFGDDVRAIDWNVTARYQTPHIKIFQEERALNLLLLVDVSASMQFGTTSQTKRDLAHELAAVLALAAHQNGDQTGLILFSDRIEHFVPPAKGHAHVLRLVRDMLATPTTGRKTNLAAALQFAMRMVRQKSILCIFSDFLTGDYRQVLQLSAARHEVIGMHVSDIREAQMPSVGWLPVRDAETGKTAWLPTFRNSIRRKHQTSHTNQLAGTQAIFKDSGADLLCMRTGEDYVPALGKHFTARK